MSSRRSALAGLWAAAGALRGRVEARQRIARAAAAWMVLALSALVTLVSLIVWHLIRRGRLIREALPPPRGIRLPELQPADPDRFSSES